MCYFSLFSTGSIIVAKVSKALKFCNAPIHLLCTCLMKKKDKIDDNVCTNIGVSNDMNQT